MLIISPWQQGKTRFPGTRTRNTHLIRMLEHSVILQRCRNKFRILTKPVMSGYASSSDIHFSASSQKNPSYHENNGLNFVEITVITNQEVSEQWNCNLRWIFRNRDHLFTNIGFNKVSTYKNLGWDRYMLSLKNWKILLLLPVITSCRLFPWVE